MQHDAFNRTRRRVLGGAVGMTFSGSAFGNL